MVSNKELKAAANAWLNEPMYAQRCPHPYIIPDLLSALSVTETQRDMFERNWKAAEHAVDSYRKLWSAIVMELAEANRKLSELEEANKGLLRNAHLVLEQRDAKDEVIEELATKLSVSDYDVHNAQTIISSLNVALAETNRKLAVLTTGIMDALEYASDTSRGAWQISYHEAAQWLCKILRNALVESTRPKGRKMPGTTPDIHNQENWELL